MSPRLAFLALGQLHLYEEGASRPFESPFAAEVLRRHSEIQKRHAWKNEGRGARFMMGGMAWEMPDESQPMRGAVYTSLSRGAEAGELLYGLQAAGVHGICRLRLEGLQEQRLVHEQGRLPGELSAGGSLIACAVAGQDGTSCIAVMDADGGHLRELTEGDSQDGAPAWKEGSQTTLVFQSAGIGRNGQGEFLALGPSAIHALDVHSGDLDTLLASPTQDHLAPRLQADGTLYCIRRPYAAYRRPGFGTYLGDVLRAPFRLLGAIGQYLNLFSANYTGKPLLTAHSGRKGADWRRLTLLANRMDAASEHSADAPLVPKDWALLRVRPDGRQEVLAEHVLAFDLAPGGRIYYTTGTGVFSIEEGRTAKLFTHPAIQQVVAL